MEILILLLFIGVCLFFAALSGDGGRKSGRKSKTTPVSSFKAAPKNNWGMAHPKNQIEAIAKVNFERIPLVNKSEYRVLTALEQFVDEYQTGHRVMAQTSMGEVLKPKDNDGEWYERKNAYASINSKRMDFALISKTGYIDLAVEYQGKGHHQGNAFARDAVKKEALRRAGVPVLEVNSGMKPSMMRAQLKELLGIVEKQQEISD